MKLIFLLMIYASFDIDKEDDDGASGGNMAGAAANASVQTFPGHTHMIGPQVIHHNNVVDENAWYVRIGFPPEQIRKGGKFTCPRNIISPLCPCNNNCHKRGQQGDKQRC